MKKAVSLLASFTLAFSLFGAPVMGFADDAAASDDQGTETATALSESSRYASAERDSELLSQIEKLEQSVFQAAAAPSTGSVEVRLTTVLADASVTSGLQATVLAGSTPGSQQVVKQAGFAQKSVDELAEGGSVAKLEGLTPGSYVLRIAGAGFLTYSQPIEVAAGDRSVIALVDRYADATCTGEGGQEVSIDQYAGRGLLPYGDLNGNNAIDAGDAKMLLSAIATVRAGGALSDTDAAKYSLGLVRESSEPATTGVIEDPGIPDPQADEPVAQSDDAATTYSEIQSFGADGDAAPELREDTATEEVIEAPVVADDDANAGVIEKLKTTEALPVGLNAFQMLASLRGSAPEAGTVRTTKETSHMQAAVTEGSEVVLDGATSIAEALFNDNGETVKMKLADESKAISEDDPVQLAINANDTEMGAFTIAIPSDSPNAPTAGQIVVETSDGDLLTYDFAVAKTTGQTSSVFDLRSNLFAAAGESRYSYFDNSASRTAEVSSVGDLITVDLGGQIPVKVITIRVTATSSNKLAEIAQVEFLNGMEDKIPEPELDIPTKLQASAGSKQISLTWDQQRNVTGYEVEISSKGSAKVIGTTKNSAEVTSFNGKDLVNYTPYTLRVRSVNGDWRSPWSQAVTATPQAKGKPMAPAAPTVKGNYNSLSVSWKAAEDAETHNVYYKKHSDSNYIQAVSQTGSLSCVISNLDLSTTYDVVVTGVNTYGESDRSPVSSATTTPDKVKVPWYKLINRTVQNIDKGTSYPSNIESVSGDNGTDGGDPMAMVDGNYDTYYSGKKGGYHHGGTVTFTQPYDMDTIMLTGYQGQSLNIYHVQIQAWDASGNEIKPNGNAISYNLTTYDDKTKTVMIHTPKLEGVKKIRVAYQRAVGTSWSASTIAELAFYDTTLYSDTMNLWADDEHTTLNDWVTMDRIEALITEANTPDSTCGEYHPSKTLILAELQNAKDVCSMVNARAAVKVDPKFNTHTNYAKKGVSGLNGWQPTGVAVEAGDEIAIYIGKKGETSRDVPLAFWVVQNHPEISNGFATRLTTVDGSNPKVGLNTFRVPEGLTSLNMERGGNLYVEYATYVNNTDQYTVRVSGGTYVPVLDVHDVSGTARTTAIKDYVTELKSYDAQAIHNEMVSTDRHDTHTDSSAYDAANCIANATDIVMNDMMYSIPVSTVQAALGVTASSTDAQLEAAATKLATSIDAMEDQMTLFYQHKGFVKDNTAGSTYGTNNSWPTLHQNIRYVRMSGSVFMYAAGNHIGVPYGSTGSLVSSGGVQLDENGKWTSGGFFGWGIAHEIGHEINQSCYTYAEVTNNYYSQLSQATDSLTDPRIRWNDYDTIYDRVTSGAKGAAAGVTGIAMYWQLHLAYDDGYNYQTYATGSEMYNNLVFARMDAYARNTSAAPQAATGGHALTLSGANKDNAIMRLACAATKKNLISFFEAWGLTPDAETLAYAGQWPEETRAIQYETDALRLYRIGDVEGMSSYGLTGTQAEGEALKATAQASLGYTTISGRPNTTNDQTIAVNITNASTNKEILGYEVLRNGEVVGFLRANDFVDGTGDFAANGSATFYDTIQTVNNRVFSYSVRAVDKLLGVGNAIPAGEVKVSHKNALDKKSWTAETNMTAESVAPNETVTSSSGTGDNLITYDVEENTTETTTSNHPVAKAIDGNTSTVFNGSTSGADARMTINFNDTVTIVGLQYRPGNVANAASAYTIETTADGVNWTTVKTGTFALDGDGIATVYFERAGDEYLYGHDAAQLRLTLNGQTSFTAAEIDVLGPQGDDAEFLANGIGILSKEEKLGTSESGKEATIPAGSLVFVGTYSGNPAYNALLLYDQNGKVLGGVSEDGAIHAKEVIFAPPVADGEQLGSVTKGYWVYYIEPTYLPQDYRTSITAVKAELYRVDDAHTLEGQRLVADTLTVTMPTDLSNLDLSFGQVATQAAEPEAQADTGAEAEQNQNLAVTGNEGEQAAGTPIEGEQAAGTPIEGGIEEHTVGGYSYDLAQAYGTPGTTDSSSMGSPIYGGSTAGSSMGTPLYDTPVTDYSSAAMGTPIYDNATPLAAPEQDDEPFAGFTLKSIYEGLLKLLASLTGN